jgi:hypothetical protein
MMEHTLPYTAALIPHPETRSQTVHEINVELRWLQDGTLALVYVLKGNCARLRIPPPRPSARIDGLWRHACFEMFVSVPGDSAYQEFNFSPSSEWARYHFRGYRDRLPLEEEEPAPQILTRREEKDLELEARVHLSHLFMLQSLRLALSAVIEDDAGMLSYWALKHPPGKPDFHHPEAFALEIAPLRRAATRRENQ